jgi:hypothetical protein
MITIKGIHKVMGMETEEGWRVTHISETPKDYVFKLIKESKIWNPYNFTPEVREEETDIILSREGGYLMCEGGFKFDITHRGLNNIETFLKALNIVVTALQFDTPNS